MVIIKDNIGRGLYQYNHDGTYLDIYGNKISETFAKSITYEYYLNNKSK